jgi:hypothetical protein
MKQMGNRGQDRKDSKIKIMTNAHFHRKTKEAKEVLKITELRIRRSLVIFIESLSWNGKYGNQRVRSHHAIIPLLTQDIL